MNLNKIFLKNLKQIQSRYFALKKFEIKKFADSVESVTISKINVKIGDYVVEDQEILEFDSDKGTTA